MFALAQMDVNAPRRFTYVFVALNGDLTCRRRQIKVPARRISATAEEMLHSLRNHVSKRGNTCRPIRTVCKDPIGQSQEMRDNG
jgi:hypothetical protein